MVSYARIIAALAAVLCAPIAAQEAPAPAIPSPAADLPELYALYDFRDGFDGSIDPVARGVSSRENSIALEAGGPRKGGACIAARGTIGGGKYSELSVEFDFRKYLGVDTYDFSKKAIVVAAFVPEGSPIDAIVLDLRKGDRLVTISEAAFPSRDPYKEDYSRIVPKGRWVEATIDVKGVFDRRAWGNTWSPTGTLSNEQAMEVVIGCDTLKIYGSRLGSGAETPAYFLIDDLRWLERNHIRTDPSVLSLRALATGSGKYVGSVAENKYLFSLSDLKFSQAFAQEFSLVIPETFQLERLQPSEGAFDLSQVDRFMDYAAGNGLAVKSYAGLDHVQLPEWIKEKSYIELGPILLRYIDEIGARQRGKVAEWNVVNEVVNSAGDGLLNRKPRNPADYSPWVEGNDASLIKAAFREARRVDPGAKLFLNDAMNEEKGRARADYFYKFVEDLVKEGVPIDGVGFELHCLYPTRWPGKPWESCRVQDLDSFFKRVDANVKRFAKLGLLVDFSEIEVPLGTAGMDPSTPAGRTELGRKLDYQARIYGGLMRIAMDNPNVSSYIVWGFADHYSWVGEPAPNGLAGYAYPDLLGEGYWPKPAYFETMKELARGR